MSDNTTPYPREIQKKECKFTDEHCHAKEEVIACYAPDVNCKPGEITQNKRKVEVFPGEFISDTMKYDAFPYNRPTKDELMKGRSKFEVNTRTAEQALMRQFETGATRNVDNDKLDFEGFLSPLVLTEYAKYLHKHRLQADGKLRASDNWQKGIPKPVYMKSMLRHVIEAWTAHRSIPEGAVPKNDAAMIEALMAIVFNAFGYTQQILESQNKSTKMEDGYHV